MTESRADITVERVERFEAAPEVVWEAITDPELLAEWFGPVGFDLRPGGAITVDERVTIGVVEVFEPDRRIGFVWAPPGAAPSSVEITIDDDDTGAGTGSILRIREVLVRPDWEHRPAWFPSSPRASARA
jgi:uncharacterized protein YndB with AHSA1/START domain